MGASNSFRRKRIDTTVASIEKTYNINLNARSDMLLGNLLEERGFDSLTHLLTAYRGKLTRQARKRRVFLSFHAEDIQQVRGFRLMLANINVGIELHDHSLRAQVNSDNTSYIRSVILEKIRSCSVVVCLIGDETARSEWVEWELAAGLSLGKGICGIKLKGSSGRAPAILKGYDAPVAAWALDSIVAAIECAAARRGRLSLNP